VLLFCRPVRRRRFGYPPAVPCHHSSARYSGPEIPWALATSASHVFNCSGCRNFTTCRRERTRHLDTSELFIAIGGLFPCRLYGGQQILLGDGLPKHRHARRHFSGTIPGEIRAASRTNSVPGISGIFTSDRMTSIDESFLMISRAWRAPEAERTSNPDMLSSRPNTVRRSSSSSTNRTLAVAMNHIYAFHFPL
jgi:hypothetical protein